MLIIRFANHTITENVQIFWSELQRGEFISDAAGRGRDLKCRCLSFAEREQLGLARVSGLSMRAIAAQLGRSPSTISRELRRNREPAGGYLASSAHAMAYHRASRPKPAKLTINLALRTVVERDMERRYSPEQIAGRLRIEFPDDPEMRVPRDDLPVDLRAISGRITPGSGRVSTHRAGAAAPESQARPTQEPHPVHDQYQRAPG